MTPLLRLEGISKRYGGVRALAGARLECERGRIHAVLGENGAGKSTLIKVIAGVVKPDAGTIELAGKPIVLATPAAANRAGIVSVFQELSLLPDLTVADNIGIIDPPKKGWRSSSFPTACTRSPSSRTIARSTATAATSPPSPPAARARARSSR